MRPQAMKPGMSGMKMLAMRLKKSLTGVAFRARIRAWRATPSPICGWELRASGQVVSACGPAAAGAAWRSVCRAASTAAAEDELQLAAADVGAEDAGDGGELGLEVFCDTAGEL